MNLRVVLIFTGGLLISCGGLSDDPSQRIQVSGFYMDAHEVTNAQFAEFIQATGYVTVAERVVETSQGVFDPGSMVFEVPEDVFDLRDHGQWWRWRTSANWKCPEGVGSTWENRKNHPVVHVAYEDASAYANWRNCRLPTRQNGNMLRQAEERKYGFLGAMSPGRRRLSATFGGCFPDLQSRKGWIHWNGTGNNL